MVSRLGQRSTDRGDLVLGDIAEDAIARDHVEETKRALDVIGDKYRDVLILYSAFDLSYAEIAQALGLRIGTVRSRISRGRNQLRELLSSSGQYGSEGDQTGRCPSAAEETQQ